MVHLSPELETTTLVLGRTELARLVSAYAPRPGDRAQLEGLGFSWLHRPGWNWDQDALRAQPIERLLEVWELVRK